MSEFQYAIAILKEKLGNADKHNLQFQRFSIADMEAIWGVLAKCETDYAELKAQRDALAGECAALKEGISDITFMDDDSFFSSTRKAQDVMGKLVNIKTPATDAYLNAVRAEGVEKAAEYLFEEKDIGAYEHECLTAFAAQLRAGEPS